MLLNFRREHQFQLAIDVRMEQFQCSLTIHLGTSAESGILSEEAQNPSMRVCLRQIIIFRQDAVKPLLKTGRVRRVRVSLFTRSTINTRPKRALFPREAADLFDVQSPGRVQYDSVTSIVGAIARLLRC